MYTLIRSVSLRDLLIAQGPALLISLAIAVKFFNKMGSFMAELAAFLVTWFVVDFIVTHAWQFLRRQGDSAPRQ